MKNCTRLGAKGPTEAVSAKRLISGFLSRGVQFRLYSASSFAFVPALERGQYAT